MRIKITGSTNKIGSEDSDEIEIGDDEVEGMSEDERAEYIEEAAQETALGLFEWRWEIIDEEQS